MDLSETAQSTGEERPERSLTLVHPALGDGLPVLAETAGYTVVYQGWASGDRPPLSALRRLMVVLPCIKKYLSALFFSHLLPESHIGKKITGSKKVEEKV